MKRGRDGREARRAKAEDDLNANKHSPALLRAQLGAEKAGVAMAGVLAHDLAEAEDALNQVHGILLQPNRIVDFLERQTDGVRREIIERYKNNDPPDGLNNIMPPLGDVLPKQSCTGPLDGACCMNTSEDTCGLWDEGEWTCWYCHYEPTEGGCCKNDCPRERQLGQCERCTPSKACFSM